MTIINSIPSIKFQRIYIEWTSTDQNTNESTLNKFYFDAVLEERIKTDFDFAITPTLRTNRVYNAFQETGYYRKPIEISFNAVLAYIPSGVIFQNGYEYLTSELTQLQKGIAELVGFQDISDIQLFRGGASKYAALESIARSGELLTVRTTTATFSNMGIASKEVIRSLDDRSAMFVTIRFIERRQQNITFANIESDISAAYSDPKSVIDQTLQNTGETSADLGDKTRNDLQP